MRIEFKDILVRFGVCFFIAILINLTFLAGFSVPKKIPEQQPVTLLINPTEGYETKLGSKVVEVLSRSLSYNVRQLNVIVENYFPLKEKADYTLSVALLTGEKGGTLNLSLLNKSNNQVVPFKLDIKKNISKNALKNSSKIDIEKVAEKILKILPVKFNKARWKRYLKNATLSIVMRADREEDAPYKVGENVTIFYQSTQDCYFSIYEISKSGNIKRIIPNEKHTNNFLPGAVIRSFTSKVKWETDKIMFKIVATLEPSAIAYNKEYTYKNPPMLVIPTQPTLFGDNDGREYYSINRDLYSTDFVEIKILQQE